MKEKFMIKIETLHASGAGDSENVSKPMSWIVLISFLFFPFFSLLFQNKKMNKYTNILLVLVWRARLLPSSSFPPSILNFLWIKTKNRKKTKLKNQ